MYYKLRERYVDTKKKKTVNIENLIDNKTADETDFFGSGVTLKLLLFRDRDFFNRMRKNDAIS